MGEKNNCFVIQRFDSGGPIDGRFDEVLAPAIRAAGIERDHTERDLWTSVPIERIEIGICRQWMSELASDARLASELAA